MGRRHDAGTRALADSSSPTSRELQRKVRRSSSSRRRSRNGADELLDEVSKSKITGEEERYSHIDLVDFEANVDGLQAAFDARHAGAALQERRPGATIDARFDAVDAALGRYGDGAGFVRYDDADPGRRRAAQRSAVDALAEPLSQASAQRRRG